MNCLISNKMDISSMWNQKPDEDCTQIFQKCVCVWWGSNPEALIAFMSLLQRKIYFCKANLFNVIQFAGANLFNVIQFAGSLFMPLEKSRPKIKSWNDLKWLYVTAWKRAMNFKSKVLWWILRRYDISIQTNLQYPTKSNRSGYRMVPPQLCLLVYKPYENYSHYSL
jgi:hypothetical protein